MSTTEPSKEIIGIIGAGAMGRGIAQIAVTAGYPVLLWDAQEGACENAAGFIKQMIDRSVEKGKLARDAADAALARLGVARSKAELKDAAVIVEAIIERLDIKQQLFQELEGIVSESCVLASNTSSLSVTSIAAACKSPGRVAGYHFFNPVPAMKVVEVIEAVRTEAWATDKLTALAKAMGHRPVRAKDTPGFLVNHAGRGLGTEGLRVVSEGVASYRDVDEVMREGVGFRMGPFELFDLTGLDVSQPVMESVYNQFYQEPRFRPSPLAAQRFVAGLLGRKTGQGFYVYDKGEKVLPSAPAASETMPVRIWIGAASAESAELFAKLAKAAGVAVESGAKPSADALALLTPIGSDATSEALRLGLDARQCVAVDPLFGLTSRRTLMTTPLSDPKHRDAAHALLASDDVPVTTIHDSAGFIAQRIVAMIVNIGCDIAQQRIATPDDIDAAVQLGLGYPKGPLALGDAVGPKTILAILEGLTEFYGDPRYRPSPWLKRRARLGASLKQAEG